ncbi:hypothetical protein K227x_07690 [Rubripirellula lacrimiformis]|uniref:Thioredoxin domain-containing protein n=1 Tax=Rubripirellula lacrimiformis TaxID=1930273 RepID=A0A517N5J9_9BACT|nr:SCO family protein [Rubripirellula lacrimiformis]QDT02393.1 hypothetical protein K227x_07690 [Rubripirellula lacrimiformis]
MKPLPLQLTCLLLMSSPPAWALQDATLPNESVCQVTGEATCCCTTSQAAVSRTTATYSLPKLRLTDADGNSISLATALSRAHPVVMQFAFTSCSTICPVASATMASVQKSLGDQAKQVRFCTISIDPEYDTPARLTEFSKTLGADAGWCFLTGDPHDISLVQKAFTAYVPNKSRHEPLTFVRAANSDQWLRITGLVSTKDLLADVQSVLARTEKP